MLIQYIHLNVATNVQFLINFHLLLVVLLLLPLLLLLATTTRSTSCTLVLRVNVVHIHDMYTRVHTVNHVLHWYNT